MEELLEVDDWYFSEFLEIPTGPQVGAEDRRRLFSAVSRKIKYVTVGTFIYNTAKKSSTEAALWILKFLSFWFYQLVGPTTWLVPNREKDLPSLTEVTTWHESFHRKYKPNCLFVKSSKLIRIYKTILASQDQTRLFRLNRM